MYGIVDCDNCYVSCERVFRPDLEGKVVVVLSNNDGCIVREYIYDFDSKGSLIKSTTYFTIPNEMKKANEMMTRHIEYKR